MDASVTPSGSGDHARLEAAATFISDARLALAFLNHARYFTLKRVFGVSREQANLLTFVLALGGLDVTAAGVRRVARAPYQLSGSDTLMGGFLLREGAFGIAGQSARRVPLAGGLLVTAMLGSLAVPELRKAAHRTLEAQQRVREQRIRIHRAERDTRGASSVGAPCPYLTGTPVGRGPPRPTRGPRIGQCRHPARVFAPICAPTYNLPKPCAAARF